jgi:hypothetical protein
MASGCCLALLLHAGPLATGWLTDIGQAVAAAAAGCWLLGCFFVDVLEYSSASYKSQQTSNQHMSVENYE